MTNSAAKFKIAMLAGAAILALSACSGTEIVSPGGATPPPTPTPAPPPPPPPPPSAAINFVPAGGCPAGTAQTTLAASGSLADADVCAISGSIAADMTIPAGLTVAINGPTFVGSADGTVTAELTIEDGVTLFGADDGDFLAVGTGSTLTAIGTETSPIIFTAREDVNDAETGSALIGAGSRGLWGGLVINGLAPINACDDATATGGTAACQASGEGSTGVYGGDQPADNSGTLQFLQVRYAGDDITPENELNGIAFQGVGSGTVVNNIQVFNNDDDGVEFFGGTVSASFVALNGHDDDSLDWTDGWTGNLQFVLIQHAGDTADQGIEADNNGDNNDALPRSNPTISNISIIGNPASSDIGMLLREGTAATIVNGVITGGFGDGAFDVDDQATFDNIGAATDGLTVASFILDDPLPYVEEAGDTADLSTVFGANVNVITDDATLQSGLFPGAQETSLPMVDPTSLGAFFQAADAVGAFRTSDTPAANWATGWTFGIVPEAVLTCPANTTEGDAVNGEMVCVLPNVIDTDTTLTAGPLYMLNGPTFVGGDLGSDPAVPAPGVSSATLTIDGGVTIFGAADSDFLVINRGSQIAANGTANAPIIFTAIEDLLGTATPASRGLWGGLIINGRAPINACSDATATGGTVDCEAEGEGSTGVYGGATPDDDSGNLFFVQVSYAGDDITPENELNGIAFQGVGSATNVDSVQVYNNDDDGVEFFGGTVNASRLLLTGNDDDSIDWTDGWTGNIQFAIVQHSADNGDQGIEADNNGDNNAAQPVSDPTLSNITLISQSRDIGALFREGTGVTFVNSVVVGFEDGGIDIDDAATFNNFAGGTMGLARPIRIESVFLDNIGPDLIEEAGDDPVLSTVINMNIVSGTSDLSGQSFVTGAPGIVPGPNITGATAIDPTTLGGFFEAGTFVGAVSGAADTTFEGWTFDETP